jgi:hypothetical protein
VRGAVAPGAFELQHDITSASALEPFVGDRRAGDVAAQAFEVLALMRATAHRGMQAEAVRIGAQGVRGFLVPAAHRSQAEHLVSGARPKGDAIGARGRLQGRERVIGIDVGHVGHALLFDQMALAGEHFQEARDDRVEQTREFWKLRSGAARACAKRPYCPDVRRLGPMKDAK